MEKFIEVYEKCVPSTLADKIEDSILNSQPSFSTHPYGLPPKFPFYFVKNVANRTTDHLSPGLSNLVYSILNGKRDSFEFYFLNIFYAACLKANILVENIIQTRSFLHLPSPNPGPDTIHTDLDINHWVFLYYINDSDGDTIFYDDDQKNEIKRVTPSKGKGVFFDGSIPHCSSRPSNSQRCILNYNFIGTKL